MNHEQLQALYNHIFQHIVLSGEMHPDEDYLWKFEPIEMCDIWLEERGPLYLTKLFAYKSKSRRQKL